MRIGFHLPANFAFSPLNGIREEALLKASGLEALGHTVVMVNAWEPALAQGLDVLHFFYGGLPLAGVEVARQCGVKGLVFSTTIDSNESHWAYRVAARLGGLSSRLFTVQGEFMKQCRQADLVVVRSVHEKERVCASLSVPEHKVEIVPLGILTDNDEIDFGPGRSGIFHLSTYGQARKNVARMIDAVGPTGLQLTIAGHSDAEAAQQLADRAAQYSNIRFLGTLSQQDKVALYRSSSVFLLPSLHEGTGLSALEAAVNGCKVVITRNGGPPDYFDEGLGWLVDPHSVSDIRAKVEAACSAPWGLAQVQAARRRFSHLVTAAQLIKAYERVLGMTPSEALALPRSAC